MKKILISLLITLNLYAVDASAIIGSWHTSATIQNKSSVTTEKELLELRANNTFDITLLVSVEAPNAYLKNLKIKASGSYKLYNDLVIVVIKRVYVPMVEDVKNISQSAVDRLAEKFKAKYSGEPILISKIQSISASQMTLLGENGASRTYSRQ
jgi:hypothetical protein